MPKGWRPAGSGYNVSVSVAPQLGATTWSCASETSAALKFWYWDECPSNRSPDNTRSEAWGLLISEQSLGGISGNGQIVAAVSEPFPGQRILTMRQSRVKLIKSNRLFGDISIVEFCRAGTVTS